MRVYSKESFLQQDTKGLLDKVFIYPTDTIYGIGCNALDKELVSKIRELKKRETKPFSVIAPSKKWIRDHCVIPKAAEEWLQKLPGPYTLVLQMKKQLPEEITLGAQTLGVRIPDHWIADVVQQAGIPIVTTSANVTGEPPLMDPKENRLEVDFIIEEGILHRSPSIIVLLDREHPQIVPR